MLRSGHPSCMELGDVCDVVRSYPWRCTECKICEICQLKGDDVRCSSVYFDYLLTSLIGTHTVL